MKRTGTSLSLSENEMDSDIEVDLTLAIREHQNFKTRSTPQTPVNMLRSMAHIDNIDGYLQQNNANTPHIPAKSLENLSSKWNNSKQLNDNDNDKDNGNGNTASSGNDITKINTTEDNSTTTTAKTTTTTTTSS